MVSVAAKRWQTASDLVTWLATQTSRRFLQQQLSARGSRQKRGEEYLIMDVVCTEESLQCLNLPKALAGCDSGFCEAVENHISSCGEQFGCMWMYSGEGWEYQVPRMEAFSTQLLRVMCLTFNLSHCIGLIRVFIDPRELQDPHRGT